METIICEICKQSFKVKSYRKNKARFCSAACYGIHQRSSRLGVGRKRVIVKCVTCGKEIEKQPSAVNDSNFCNRKCFGIWRASTVWTGENSPVWIGGYSEYRGPNWKRQKGIALFRDDFTCRQCGDSGILHVHHIKPYQLFDHYKEANDISNLITLCPACHSAAECLFWKQHPDLIKERKIPGRANPKKCKKCGENFIGRSSASLVCDKCCWFTCQYCGKEFYCRKKALRNPKYCSRQCRHSDVKSKDKVCPQCDGPKHIKAARCRDCDTKWYRANQDAPRRGRKVKAIHD